MKLNEPKAHETGIAILMSAKNTLKMNITRKLGSISTWMIIKVQQSKFSEMQLIDP